MVEVTGGDDAYRGQRLGLPASGPGALATWRARFTGLVLDWALSLLLTALVFGRQALTGSGLASAMTTPAIFFVLTTIVITFTGSSVGQLLCRIGVARLDGNPVGLGRAAARQILVCLVIPALVIDGQRRGLQDLALGLVVTNRRPG
ncbi:MAG: RDD family protein [Propionibacteriaceae bacterium]